MTLQIDSVKKFKQANKTIIVALNKFFIAV